MLSERQKQFDKLKLELSIFLGVDACGRLDFCKYCNKSEENPCDNAEKRCKEKQAGAKKPQSKKVVSVNGKTAQFRATIVDK